MGKKYLLVCCLSLFMAACGGIEYSKSYIDSEYFKAERMAVLPIRVGNYEMSREVVEYCVARGLAATGRYKEVVDSQMLKARIAEVPEFGDQLSDYIVRLNTLGVSDRETAQKIGELYKVQAILLVNVTDWGYGRLEGVKSGQVGLSVVLVDTDSGGLVWKGSHRIVEDYSFFRPDLKDICDDVVTVLLEEMPH